MSALQPPRINTTDPNQQELSEGDHSDDHFSSATEGSGSRAHSPIPTTRVERVTDDALHGEVPGTPAYDQRSADAVPDEIEVIPEGNRSRSVSAVGNRSRSHSQLSVEPEGPGSRPATPGGTPIPKTIVEKVDFKPSYGEVEGTPAKEMRMADAMPDEVRSAPREVGERLEGRLGAEAVEDESEEGRQAWFRNMWESKSDEPRQREEEDDEDEDEDAEQDAAKDNDDEDFGDDFDEFAEGDGDEDFGDFDEADDEPPAQPQQRPQASARPPSAPDILAGLPPLDFSKCTTPSEIQEAIAPYINAILPNSHPIPSPTSLDPSTAPTSPFLSDRSLSLWQQLVSPPPMQPPNWTRSRIRRLFLVSLGVPVDLDEILPPSKQKRLILPYTGFESNPTLPRLKTTDEGGVNSSTTSLDSKTGTPRPSKTLHRRTGTTSGRAGPPPPPEFDVLAAGRLATTTEERLLGLGDEELRAHVVVLGEVNSRASEVLEYWLLRKDEGLKEKEALEGVIENLVGFVKGRRGGGKR